MLTVMKIKVSVLYYDSLLYVTMNININNLILDGQLLKMRPLCFRTIFYNFRFEILELRWSVSVLVEFMQPCCLTEQKSRAKGMKRGIEEQNFRVGRVHSETITTSVSAQCRNPN